MKIPGKSCDVPSSKPERTEVLRQRAGPVYVCMYVRATLRIFTIAVIKILQRVQSAGIVPFD